MRGLRTALTAGLAAAFIVVIPGSAPAASIHNVPGDFATIQAAIDAAVSGDTIQIEAGTYVENLNTLGKDLTIAGTSAETVTIQGNGDETLRANMGETITVRDVTMQNGANYAIRGDDVQITVETSVIQNNGTGGVFVEGNTSTLSVTDSIIRDNLGCRAGVMFEHGVSVIVARNLIEDNGVYCPGHNAQGIDVNSGNATTVLIEDNIVDGSGKAGVRTRSSGSIVQRNVITNHDGAGLELDGDGSIARNNVIFGNGFGLDLSNRYGLTITHNTVAHNEYQQIWSNYVRSDVVIANNIFQGDGSAPLLHCSEVEVGAVFSGNIVWNPGGNLRSGGCPRNGINDELNADPLLVDPRNGLLTPSFGSPAVDSADPAHAAAIDVDGTPRPIDGDVDTVAAPDVGAIEFDPGPQFVHGLVTSELDGRPVPGACVMLFDGGTKVAETKTNEIGGFSVTHDPGSYKVKYADCRWRLHRPTFHGGPTFGTAIPVLLLPAGAPADAEMELFANCDGQKPTIIGTDADDVLTGTSADDVISGGAGDDVLIGLGGADTLCGGKGKDTLEGDGGADLLIGGNDGDLLDGGGGSDVLLGGGGWDTLIGGFGNDDLQGGPQTDTIDYADSHVAVVVKLPQLTATGPGFDTLASIENVIGSDHDDTIIGNGADNVLRGGDGADEIHGGAGDDRVLGGQGEDLLGGGPGSDLIDATNWDLLNDTVTFARSPAGVDVQIDSLNGTAQVGGDVDTLLKVRRIIGSPFGDSIYIVDDGISTISGGAGNDDIEIEIDLERDAIVWGDGGDDTIHAGIAAHQTMIFGGPGNDTLVGRSDRGTFGDGGNDTISGSGLLDGGPGTDNITGLNTADILLGGGGDDLLKGGAGPDLIVGGQGNDQLIGQLGDDTLVGEAGHDNLSGGEDDDVLSGGAGNDFLGGGLGDDWITFELSPFPVDVDFGAKTASGNGADTFNTVEWVFGSEHDDVLSGWNGTDLLVGWFGNDTLFGKAGSDILDGMDGTDDLNGQGGTDFCYNGETHSGCETIDVFPDMGFDMDSIRGGLLAPIRHIL